MLGETIDETQNDIIKVLMIVKITIVIPDKVWTDFLAQARKWRYMNDYPVRQSDGSCVVINDWAMIEEPPLF